MIIAAGILIIVWTYIMFLFYKNKMYFFKFIIGSLGLFCILMYFGRDGLSEVIKYGIIYPLSLIGDVTGLFYTYINQSVVTVFHNNQSLSYYISYECSGVVETLVFISLLTFYPVYNWINRLKFYIVGTLYIIVMNIVRLLIITLIVKYLGSSYFFFSHVILSRIIFFGFMVVLYYEVFTKPHILRQKVGKINVAA